MPSLRPSRARRRRGVAALLTATGLLLGLGLPGVAAAAAPATVGAPTVLPDRDETASPLIERGSYDYAPSVLWDPQARLYRMWWCGGLAGDHILYAESTSLAGPFHSRLDYTPHSYDVAIGPHSDPEAFDHTHTCDPSVIKVDGTFYLYYGGANRVEQGETTRIGLATSTDGVTWTRANGGRSIVEPVRDIRRVRNPYGAGQPSVTYVGGMFHLVYTDTTGYGGNQVNGAGQYVLRSPDPTFQTRVEELTRDGFQTYYPFRHTRYSLLQAFSTDWQYSRVLDAFVLSESRTNPDMSKSVRVHFFTRDLKGRLPGSPVVLPAEWSEGTALVGRMDRRLAPPVGGKQRLEVVRPVGEADPFTWRLLPLVAEVPVTRPRS